MNISLRGSTFLLLPSKAVYWIEKKTLIISDLHLGKTLYFRYRGIPAPEGSDSGDLHLLKNLLVENQAESLILLGDVFHSGLMKDGGIVNSFTDLVSSINYKIIKGNHDKLKGVEFARIRPHLMESYETEEFIFSHKHFSDQNKFVFAGHIHPAVYLRGPGKQNERLPCFYFTHDFAILPSFGSFTGTFIISPRDGDRVFIPADDKVIELF